VVIIRAATRQRCGGEQRCCWPVFRQVAGDEGQGRTLRCCYRDEYCGVLRMVPGIGFSGGFVRCLLFLRALASCVWYSTLFMAQNERLAAARGWVRVPPAPAAFLCAETYLRAAARCRSDARRTLYAARTGWRTGRCIRCLRCLLRAAQATRGNTAAAVAVGGRVVARQLHTCDLPHPAACLYSWLFPLVRRTLTWQAGRFRGHVPRVSNGSCGLPCQDGRSRRSPLRALLPARWFWPCLDSSH